MAVKRILMLVGDFGEDYDIVVPFLALQAVGHTVHAVCPNKNAGESVATAIHDLECLPPYSEKRGHDFTLNASFVHTNAEQYDALVIPGGRAPEYLSRDPRVISMVQYFFTANKPVAAICNGAQLLAAAKVLDGRRCSASPGCRTDVEEANGIYNDVAITAAVTDGNLVTAPAWPAHPDWISQFLQVLGTRIMH
jgi:protease I